MPRKAYKGRAAEPPAGRGEGAELVRVISEPLRRFPWPGEAGRSFSLATPFLAVVNARGPWACWGHYRKGPAWLPVFAGLWSKAWWRQADNDLRVFLLAFWQYAADEDYWGIVWGEPSKLAYDLCRLPGLDPALIARALPVFCAAGALCYLSFAERMAVEAWRPSRKGTKTGEGGSYQGGIIGGINSSIKPRPLAVRPEELRSDPACRRA